MSLSRPSHFRPFVFNKLLPLRLERMWVSVFLLALLLPQTILADSGLSGLGWGGPTFDNNALHIIPQGKCAPAGAGCPDIGCLALKLKARDPGSGEWTFYRFDSMSEPFAGRYAVGRLRCDYKWILVDLKSWDIA